MFYFLLSKAKRQFINKTSWWKATRLATATCHFHNLVPSHGNRMVSLITNFSENLIQSLLNPLIPEDDILWML